MRTRETRQLLNFDFDSAAITLFEMERSASALRSEYRHYRPRCAWAAALLVSLSSFTAPLAAEDSLTPADIIGWMAPLRMEDGRLGIDWTAVGIIDAKLAGFEGGQAPHLDRDVKFVIQPRTESGLKEFAVGLNLKGGVDTTPNALRGTNRAELSLFYKIAERQKDEAGGLLGQFKARGALAADGQSFDASEMRLNLDSGTCLALYKVERARRDFEFEFKEERVLKYDLSISQQRGILLIHLDDTELHSGFEFTQKPNGDAELSFDAVTSKRALHAESLRDLIQANLGEVQMSFLRPLSDLGVRIALNPDLPVVMATAATGFSEPLPVVALKAETLIKAIENAVIPAERARAVTDLTRFFPQAIQHILLAAQNEADPVARAAIEKAIAAHPGIARARPYVLTQKLNDDREYLFGIFERVPALKEAARARLALLLGKDYGDDPAEWKK